MIPLPSWGLAAAAAVLFASGFAGGVKITANHWQAKQLKVERELAAAKAAEVERAAEAAAAYETTREKVRVVTKTVTQLVDRIVDRPVYRNVCLDDDGLRLANAALAGQAPDPGKPDGAVPGAGPAR